MSTKKKTSELVTGSAQIQRMLVALAPSFNTVTTLEAAAALAGRLQAELTGLFIEDIRLLQLASLPFTREVDAGSGQQRSLSSRSMSRSLRAQAVRARAVLQDVATRHRVSSRFHTTRGEMLAEIISASREVDVMVVGVERYAGAERLRTTISGVVSQCRCAVMLVQEEATKGENIIVLYDGTSAADTALALAQRLAVEQGADRVVVLTEDKKLQKKVIQQLEQTNREITYDFQILDIDASGLYDLPKILRQQQCGMFIVPQNNPVSRQMIETGALARFNCPVLLVR